jgi:hypothetical protein
MIKTFKTFEKLIYDDYGDFLYDDENFIYDDNIDDYDYIWKHYVMKKITSILGPSYIGRNADWGLTMWKLQDDNFEGFFVLIDDDNNLILLKRKFDEIDEYIISVLEGGDISELIDKVKKLSKSRKFNL